LLRETLLGPVVKLRGPWALVRGHFLRVLQRTTMGKISRNTRCAKAMITDRRVNTCRHRSAAYHAPGIRLCHGLFEEHGRVVPGRRAKEKTFAIFGDAGSVDVGTQFFDERVMARHLVVLAAFFVQTELPAGALWSEIFGVLQRGVYAGERVGEGGYQRAIAPTAQRVGRNGIQQLAPLLGVEHSGLAGFHHMLRAASGRDLLPVGRDISLP
jgi:hypothetical protein